MGGADSALSRARRGAHGAPPYGGVERSASREVIQSVEFKTSLTELLRDNATHVATIEPSRKHIDAKTPEDSRSYTSLGISSSVMPWRVNSRKHCGKKSEHGLDCSQTVGARKVEAKVEVEVVCWTRTPYRTGGWNNYTPCAALAKVIPYRHDTIGSATR